MKKLELAVVLSVMAGSLTAVPVVTPGSVTVERNGSLYSVSYAIAGDPAVVTVDVKTNGVSIGGANFASLTEAAQGVKQPGGYVHSWKPRKDWTGGYTGDVTVEVKAWSTNNPPDYMVLSFDNATKPKFYASLDTVPSWNADSHRLYKTSKMLMRKIPAAYVRWRMGSPVDEPCRNSTREVPHYVTLTENYYIGVFECTQQQYKNLSGSYGGNAFVDYDDYIYRPCGKIPYYILRGGTAKGIDWPTTGSTVSANSTIDIFRRVAQHKYIDLPTDAQWEFACRAGTGTGLYNGLELPSSATADGIAASCYDLGWYGNNCADDTTDGVAQTHEVGLKQPNGFGLYDMYGNVMEWVLDWDCAGSNFSDGTPVVDPTGPVSYTEGYKQRICRGGCYDYVVTECRSATRARGNDESSWEERRGFRFAAKAIAE